MTLGKPDLQIKTRIFKRGIEDLGATHCREHRTSQRISPEKSLIKYPTSREEKKSPAITANPKRGQESNSKVATIYYLQSSFQLKIMKYAKIHENMSHTEGEETTHRYRQCP